MGTGGRQLDGAPQAWQVGMVTPEPVFSLIPSSFPLLSVCAILPQRDRYTLRARADVRGEQARLCWALEGTRRAGLCSLSLEAAASPAPALAVGTLHRHTLTPEQGRCREVHLGSVSIHSKN